MKNRITQLSILGLLATAVVTAESCRKEDPPAETITNDDNTNNGSGSNGSGSGSGSGSGGNTVNGCTDIDSPLYSSSANNDDGSCQYAYTSGYEITYHPAQDPDGDDWDLWVNTEADLILKIKEQGASSYMFEGDEISNQDPTSAANWAAPSAVKLKNKTYEWELYDYDATSADDLISSGTFNPITSASNGTITTVAGGSQLKISYTLQ